MAELTLLDTNILVYALYDRSPQHYLSRALLTRAQAPDAALCVAAHRANS